MKGLLITHYMLWDENPYGCFFVLNDESAFKEMIARRFGRVAKIGTLYEGLITFIEDTRYADGDYAFVIGEYQYVVYIHHYLMSLVSIGESTP